MLTEGKVTSFSLVLQASRKTKREEKICIFQIYSISLHSQNRNGSFENVLVPWMSGLVSGLQNRPRRFESARNLLVTLPFYFGSLDEWLSQRSAKPCTAVRIRQEPQKKLVIIRLQAFLLLLSVNLRSPTATRAILTFTLRYTLSYMAGVNSTVNPKALTIL